MAKDYLLTSIAAVLLGMTMFEPGRCNVPGTLVGAATIGMLGNGLVLMGAPYYVQDIMLGFIIVASVAVSASALKKAAFRSSQLIGGGISVIRRSFIVVVAARDSRTAIVRRTRSSSASSRSRCRRRRTRAARQLRRPTPPRSSGWTGAAAQLRRQPAQARRADRGDDPGQGRRPHPRHGQARRGGRAVRRPSKKAGIPLVTVVVRHEPACAVRHPGQRLQIGGAQATMYLLSQDRTTGRDPHRALRAERRVAHPRQGARRDPVREPGGEGARQPLDGAHRELARRRAQRHAGAASCRTRASSRASGPRWTARRRSSTTCCARRATRKATSCWSAWTAARSRIAASRIPTSLFTATVAIPFEAMGQRRSTRSTRSSSRRRRSDKVVERPVHVGRRGAGRCAQRRQDS